MYFRYNWWSNYIIPKLNRVNENTIEIDLPIYHLLLKYHLKVNDHKIIYEDATEQEYDKIFCN